MKKHIFILSSLIIMLACNGSDLSKKKYKVENIDTTTIGLSEKTLQLLYGIDVKIDTSNLLEVAISELSRSNYSLFLSAIRNKSDVDTTWYEGYYSFQLSNTRANEFLKYLLFRYNNFFDDLPYERQLNQLVESISPKEKELYQLQNIEAMFLQNNIDNSSSDARNLISNILKLKEKFKGSKRLDFILSKEYLTIGEEEKAVAIYDKLIESNYYSLPSLRVLIVYFSRRDPILLAKYIALLKKYFPNECNIESLKLSMPKDSLLSICDLCKKSVFQKDSIKSRLFLLNYDIQTRNLRQADSLITSYFKSHTERLPDTLLLYEHGFFSDMKMHSLFIQKKFKELYKFAHDELQLNPVIYIRNNSEFVVYIEYLYSLYISKNSKDFDSFFQDNFEKYMINNNNMW